MTDYFAELGRNPQARKVVSALGLPVKLPPDLVRDPDPDRFGHLKGQRVVCAGTGPGAYVATATAIAERAGADVSVGESPHAFVLDATGVAGPNDLREVYDFLHPRVRQTARNGRIIVLGRPADGMRNPTGAAAAHALRGFVRSLAKEVGGKGTTVNLIELAQRGADGLEGPLRFFLGPRSVFVSGQVLSVDGRVEPPGQLLFEQALAGKVAVVTGAARGIGEQIALRLAQEGAHVVHVDLPSTAAELDAAVQRNGGAAFAADLTDSDAPRRLTDYLHNVHGGVDLLVHNAGITRDRTLGKMRAKSWDQVIDINFAAPLRINDELGKRALVRKDGRVVHLASIAGIGGNPGQTNYAAAKSGLIGYVAAMADAWAARGVTVNAVAPGFIETKMTAAIPVVTRELARRLNSLGQGGMPSDVADVVAFLVSPGAHGVTGATLRVCGQHLAGA